MIRVNYASVILLSYLNILERIVFFCANEINYAVQINATAIIIKIIIMYK